MSVLLEIRDEYLQQERKVKEACLLGYVTPEEWREAFERYKLAEAAVNEWLRRERQHGPQGTGPVTRPLGSSQP